MRNFQRPQRYNDRPQIRRPLPDLAPNTIRILGLGGNEESGRNMWAIEYRDTIVVLDGGIQYSALKTPGIDFILPNPSYLKEKKHKVKAIIATSPHMDHVGAIPYFATDFPQATIYARNVTGEIIKQRAEALNKKIDDSIFPIEEQMSISVGYLNLRFWNIHEDTPGELAVSVESNYGDIVYMSSTQVLGKEEAFKHFEDRNVICLLASSGNADQNFSAPKEEGIYTGLATAIHNAPGRVFVGTFASHPERIRFILDMCNQLDKKVVIDSAVIEQLVRAIKIAYNTNIYDKVIIDQKEAQNFPDNKLVYLVAKTEGDELYNLEKISNNTHPTLSFVEDDTVIFATHSIVHNQRQAQNLKDKLSRVGVHIIHYRATEINLYRYGHHEDLEFIHRKIHPTYFIPMHGYHYMLRVHADIEYKLGNREQNVIIPDNGSVIELSDEGKVITMLRDKVDTDMIVVDGASVGKIQDVVMRDRETLGEQGIFVMIAIIDTHLHKLKKSPDIASRGFVYTKESQSLMLEARDTIKNTIDAYLEKHKVFEADDLKEVLQSVVGKFLMQKTAKEPVVIPVIITV